MGDFWQPYDRFIISNKSKAYLELNFGGEGFGQTNFPFNKLLT